MAKLYNLIVIKILIQKCQRKLAFVHFTVCCILSMYLGRTGDMARQRVLCACHTLTPKKPVCLRKKRIDVFGNVYLAIQRVPAYFGRRSGIPSVRIPIVRGDAHHSWLDYVEFKSKAHARWSSRLCRQRY